MKKLFFSGVLHPERALLSVGNIENKLLTPDGKKYGSIKFNIYNNQITIFVECENDNEDIYTLRNIAKASVEIITNAIGFLKGYAYDVEIVKTFDSDLNLSHIFGIEIPAIEERNKKRELADVNNIYQLCLGPDGVYLQRCLGDLNLAIKHPHDTAFYCFRALESLKQYFGYITGVSDDAKQWKEMSKAIGGKQEDTEPIRKLAFPARHGVPEPITDQKRKEVFFTTWDIVEKFIDYRLKQCGSNFRLHPVP